MYMNFLTYNGFWHTGPRHGRVKQTKKKKEKKRIKRNNFSFFPFFSKGKRNKAKQKKKMKGKGQTEKKKILTFLLGPLGPEFFSLGSRTLESRTPFWKSTSFFSFKIIF